MSRPVTHALMALVRAYRFLLSPWLGNACRFEPTCSAYALAALDKHGALAGSLLSVGRLARCHPFCAGGHDPVPTRLPRFLSALQSDPGARPRPAGVAQEADTTCP